MSTPKEEIRRGVYSSVPAFIKEHPNYMENKLPKVLAKYMDDDGIGILQV